MSGLEGTHFHHYTLKQLLKQGGMSEVYLAWDEQYERTVAIKVVDSRQIGDSERFLREIKIIEALQHPHILPLYDSGTYEKWHYMAMPYVGNGTLHERIETGSLTEQEAGIFLNQIADALQHAHQQGIIHRDIKPSNVLLRDAGHSYLMDFGVAKKLEVDESLTKTGCVVGTPRYMAPELAYGSASVRSDVYSLGILLYQMLTGQVPFDGETPLSVCMKHLHTEPLRPSMLNPTISAAVDRVVLRALEKDPRHRFQTPQEMASAYQEALLQPPMPPTQESTGIQQRRTSQAYKMNLRNTILSVIAALILVCAAILLGLSNYADGSNDTPVAVSQAKTINDGAMVKKGLTKTPQVVPTPHTTPHVLWRPRYVPTPTATPSPTVAPSPTPTATPSPTPSATPTTHKKHRRHKK